MTATTDIEHTMFSFNTILLSLTHTLNTMTSADTCRSKNLIYSLFALKWNMTFDIVATRSDWDMNFDI